MNREQRRKYNKAHKTNFTKQEFDMMIAIERIKKGIPNFEDLDLPQDFMHIDNTELCPDGTAVKLHFESLELRCQHIDKTNELFRQWVEEAKKDPDKIYHITREEARHSLVCLEEDERYIEIDGEKKRAPRWLFDLYSDLEILHNGNWIQVGLVDSETLQKYSAIQTQKI